MASELKNKYTLILVHNYKEFLQWIKNYLDSELDYYIWFDHKYEEFFIGKGNSFDKENRYDFWESHKIYLESIQIVK